MHMPAARSSSMHDAASAESPHTGTTIVACAYDGGVVIGADGRVSTGNYISNRASNKLTLLLDDIYLARCGSAADTQFVADQVRFYAHQMSNEQQKRLSVKTLAHIVCLVNYNNKDNLQAGMLVAGWDEEEGGQVYACPIGGTMVREAWATDGSGSTYIWGYCDAEYRDGMSRAEAEAFVKEALSLAMSRDGSSGGVIRMMTLAKGEVHHTYVSGSEVPLFHEEMPPPSAMVVG